MCSSVIDLLEVIRLTLSERTSRDCFIADGRNANFVVRVKSRDGDFGYYYEVFVKGNTVFIDRPYLWRIKFSFCIGDPDLLDLIVGAVTNDCP